ncbi:PilZ domain-containing protein [Dermatobacter hominis]|uniref:PilZ domain-containing protein n=1 Tax=Dermatobacter hominis TaxID=2884263 RepID=UPI001D10CE75|nr:PilZ domain-containing protein [Dermatobacter hominis]UDY36519.1 PilZ domain-containing protein [Dermatobacter hominis]
MRGPQIPIHTGRRLGERIALGEVLISWRVDEVIPGRLRDKPRPPEIGRLLDVSVSGAAIVAPESPDLRVGRAVAIRLDGADALVRIRRMADFGQEGWRLYGVEFLESDLAFRDWINGLLDVRRPDARTMGWDRAD